MEHLLPPGTAPRLQIHQYSEHPENYEEISSKPDCEVLFETIRERYQTPGLVAPLDPHTERSLWLEQCSGGRVYNLCRTLQNHFFFGTLLQLLGPRVVVADFMYTTSDGTMFLTTKKLNQYLQVWRAEVEAMYAETRETLKDKAEVMLERSAVVLSHLAWFLEDSYGEEDTVARGWTANDEPLGSTHLACVLLHQALVTACGHVLGLDAGSDSAFVPNLAAPWLKWKMVDERWCPFTMKKLFDTCDVEEAAYACCTDTRKAQLDLHKHCSPDACMAGHDRDEIKLPHVRVDCDCWIVQAPAEDIKAIWARDQVPVLRIGTDDGYRLSLSAHHAGDENNYIAIAHLPNDNIACATRNAIAQCQLTRLADRICRLQPGSRHQPCIFVESLCVPSSWDDQQRAEVSDERLATVYRQASAMMIVDAEMWKMHLPPSMSELGMRLHLWSIQWQRSVDVELIRRPLVMTATGIIDVKQMQLSKCSIKVKEDSLAHDLEKKMIQRTAMLLGMADPLLSLAEELESR